jgi:hypothetical protein
MITEYLLKKSALNKSMITMNAELKKLVVTFAIVIILLSFFREGVEISFSNHSYRKIDIFTAKKPFDGRGINQSSDAFQPQELVNLYALVTYNDYPVANKLVAFQINNQPNAFQNITIVHASPTNQSGIAEFSFRIPWPDINAEQIIFGEWVAIATVDIAGEVVADILTFRVGWIIQVANIITLNEKLEMQTKFQRGETVVLNLAIKNIALTQKLTTIIITIHDAAIYPIVYIERENIVFQPGESNLSVHFQVPTSATTGVATISATPYTALPKMGGVPYSPPFTSTFEVFTPLKKRYYLTVKTNPPDIIYIPGEGWYDENSIVPLTAFVDFSVSVGIRYKFLHWNVDDVFKPENSITIIMDRNYTATAYYMRQYYLTVRTNPAGIATISGEGWYDALQNVTLSAVDVAGYVFERWDVDGVYFGVGDKAVTIFMDRPHVATAHYSPRVSVWYIPEWFYWLLFLLLLAIIVLIVFWLYRRRKQRRAKEAFQRGWTAWYYCYDLKKGNRRI